MNRWHTIKYFLLTFVFLTQCKQGPELNAHFKVEFGGVCDQCPTIRLDTLIRKFHPAILTVLIDSVNKTLEIGYDSTQLNITDLIFYLNSYGYDIGDNIAFEINFIDSCCRQQLISDPFSQSLGTTGTDTLLTMDDLQDIAEDPLLGLGDSNDLSLDLEEELNLDEELSKDLEQSLELDLEIGDSLELDLDMDLDL